VDINLNSNLLADERVATAKIPNEADSTRFADILAAKVPMPEQTLVQVMRNMAQRGKTPLDVIGKLGEKDIEATLAFQATTQKQIQDMTVLSKVLGAAANGINKLTSLS
jgi:hypothetical protein